MRLVSFGPRGSELPGVLVHDSVLPLGRVLTDVGLPSAGGLRGVLPFLELLAEGIDSALASAVVIGKGGRRIPAERADEHIAGYLIANDVTARDLGEGESKTLNMAPLFQLTRLKGWDTFLPTGPWLVTVDEIGSYADIRIQTWVNDEPRQDSYAKEMAKSPQQLIEWLSATTTLQPGDIITTGTPPGVAAGMATPNWLTAGDVVRIEMTGLGRMRTTVLNESAGQ